MTSEISGVSSDMYEPLGAFTGIQPNRDPLLESRQPSAEYNYPYGLLEESVDKDAHLAALINQRKAAVLSWEPKVIPADDTEDAAKAAEFVDESFRCIGNASQFQASGFERDLSELLDAIPYGFAVSELIWERRSCAIVPVALKSRHPRRFVFDEGGRLRMLTQAEPVRGIELPERKFLVFSPYGRHENPYGLPAIRSVWWLAFFKRQALKFWVMFAEKFGSPTTVLKHPLAATDKEKKAYKRIIGTIQQETGLVVPEGVELQLLEAQRSGAANTYKDLVEFCNLEMSKAILGQTLTIEPGERGARSLGEVHMEVREDIVLQDVHALEGLVNNQLVQWIVDLNFPEGRRLYPRWSLTKPASADLALQLQIDAFFTGQGLALDPMELYARYGRKQPAAAVIGGAG